MAIQSLTISGKAITNASKTRYALLAILLALIAIWVWLSHNKDIEPNLSATQEAFIVQTLSQAKPSQLNNTLQQLAQHLTPYWYQHSAAILYLQHNKPKQGIQQLELIPTHKRTHHTNNNLAVAYIQNKQYTEALALLNKSHTKKTHERVEHNIATLEYIIAAKAYITALKLAPNNRTKTFYVLLNNNIDYGVQIPAH